MRLINLILGEQKPKSRTKTIVYEIVTLETPIIFISVNKLGKLDSQELGYNVEKKLPYRQKWDGLGQGKKWITQAFKPKCVTIREISGAQDPL